MMIVLEVLRPMEEFTNIQLHDSQGEPLLCSRLKVEVLTNYGYYKTYVKQVNLFSRLKVVDFQY